MNVRNPCPVIKESGKEAKRRGESERSPLQTVQIRTTSVREISARQLQRELIIAEQIAEMFSKFTRADQCSLIFLASDDARVVVMEVGTWNAGNDYMLAHAILIYYGKQSFR